MWSRPLRRDESQKNWRKSELAGVSRAIFGPHPDQRLWFLITSVQFNSGFLYISSLWLPQHDLWKSSILDHLGANRTAALEYNLNNICPHILCCILHRTPLALGPFPPERSISAPPRGGCGYLLFEAHGRSEGKPRKVRMWRKKNKYIHTIFSAQWLLNEPCFLKVPYYGHSQICGVFFWLRHD